MEWNLARALDAKRWLAPPILLALLLFFAGCASTLKTRPADVPRPAPPAQVEPAQPPPPAPTVDEALLAARAHEAASQRAAQEGDSRLAQEELEKAKQAAEQAGLGANFEETSRELAKEPGGQRAQPDSQTEPPEPDATEVEPSPLDEIGGFTPHVDPTVIDQERGLIMLGDLEFDIPMVVNDKVVAWVDYFTNANREKFQQGLVRSGRYLLMIQQIFEEAGLPKDLAYMAHVESAYKVNAYSRAKAKGIFQFIASTGRRYGLHANRWVDERSDPEKATRAAAAYLKDLYAMFGDWYLAMAAYNAGEGKIQRVVAGTGETGFWEIADRKVLHRETNDYVPAILAATIISKDPARFGFEFEPDKPVEYDTIPVKGSVDLRVLARCAGTDFDTMKMLNPALRRSQTPPGATTEVHVPVGAGEAALAALGRVPERDKVLAVRHTVRQGETLAKIARRYRVSLASIQKANGMGKRTVVHPGEDLIIASRRSTPVAEEPPAGERTPSAGTVTYRVQAGDTLSNIARRYGTTPAAIAAASGIPTDSVLRPGQRLQVTSRATTSMASGRRPAGQKSSLVTTHTVRRGETLGRIANHYRISVDELCYLNHISVDQTIYPGTRLTVPGQ